MLSFSFPFLPALPWLFCTFTLPLSLHPSQHLTSPGRFHFTSPPPSGFHFAAGLGDAWSAAGSAACGWAVAGGWVGGGDQTGAFSYLFPPVLPYLKICSLKHEKQLMTFLCCFYTFSSLSFYISHHPFLLLNTSFSFFFFFSLFNFCFSLMFWFVGFEYTLQHFPLLPRSGFSSLLLYTRSHCTHTHTHRVLPPVSIVK